MNESQEVLKERERCAKVVERHADLWALEKKKGFFVEELRRIANEIREDPDLIVVAEAARGK